MGRMVTDRNRYILKKLVGELGDSTRSITLKIAEQRHY